MSTAYHPQTDGKTERANRTLQAVLRAYAESRHDWDEWLPFVAAAYNSTVNESTGRSPFELNFPDARSIDPLAWALEGQRPHASDRRGVSVEAKRQIDGMKAVWDEVREKIILERAKQKKYADVKRREASRYEVGDSVYLSTRNLQAYGGKLLDKWAGPYLVKQLVGDGGKAVRLDLRGELGKTHPVFNVSLLKPYVESKLEWPGRMNQNRPGPELVDGETEWEVERVMDKEVRMEKQQVWQEVAPPERPSGGRVLRARQPRRVKVTVEVPVVYYQLKWKGYDDGDTWQRADQCHCQELIDEYELLQRQQRGDSYADEGETVATMELGLATPYEWYLAEKKAGGRRGQPIVRWSHPSMQRVESAAASCAAAQQPAVLLPGVRVASLA